MNNCCCRFNCTGISVLASIIIGIIAGFLTFSGILTVSIPFLWVLFGIAIVGLGLLLSLSVLSRNRALVCLCRALTILLTGILGTILTTVILLVIDITLATVLGAILSGLLLFFFSLATTITACIIRCACDCDD